MATSEISVIPSLSTANLQFTTDLYSQLLTTNPDNIFYSPISISIAFALIHLGAHGETKAQLDSVMHYGKVENLHEAFHQLSESINAGLQKSALHLANRLFGKQDFKFLQSYIDASLKFYNAELQSLDFGGDPEGSRKVINDWVESKTNNKIKDLIPSGVLNSLTALVLVNAIYFKGEWESKFNESNTYKGDFHVSENQVVPVDFMKKKHKYPISRDKDSDSVIVELPYSDDNLSMFVFVPNEKNGLHKIETTLNVEKLTKIFSERRFPNEIILHMPKFKFEQTFQLHEVLPKMGLTDVFDERKADLSGVDGGKNGLYISKAIHKSFIEVNEEGTEAAAATAGIMMMKSMPMPPRDIKLDRPFLFAIVEKQSNSVLFIGRVKNPNV